MTPEAAIRVKPLFERKQERRRENQSEGPAAARKNAVYRRKQNFGTTELSVQTRKRNDAYEEKKEEEPATPSWLLDEESQSWPLVEEGSSESVVKDHAEERPPSVRGYSSSEDNVVTEAIQADEEDYLDDDTIGGTSLPATNTHQRFTTSTFTEDERDENKASFSSAKEEEEGTDALYDDEETEPPEETTRHSVTQLFARLPSGSSSDDDKDNSNRAQKVKSKKKRRRMTRKKPSSSMSKKSIKISPMTESNSSTKNRRRRPSAKISSSSSTPVSLATSTQKSFTSSKDQVTDLEDPQNDKDEHNQQELSALATATKMRKSVSFADEAAAPSLSSSSSSSSSSSESDSDDDLFEDTEDDILEKRAARRQRRRERHRAAKKALAKGVFAPCRCCWSLLKFSFQQAGVAFYFAISCVFIVVVLIIIDEFFHPSSKIKAVVVGLLACLLCVFTICIALCHQWYADA